MYNDQKLNYEGLRALFIQEYTDMWMPEDKFEAIEAWNLVEEQVETIDDVYELVQIRETDDGSDIFNLEDGPLY